MTALVFGDTIRINRRFWKERRFWVYLLAGLAAQCALGMLLHWSVPRVGTLLWALLLPFNYYIISAYLATVLNRRGGLGGRLL
jgi:hypothetical protein